MDKEKVFENFENMVKNSWTYDRLTLQEKGRLQEIINSMYTKKCIKGTYRQRWDTLQAIYHSFLVALDYKAVGWREKLEKTPLF